MSSAVPETAIQRIAQLAGQCAFDWDLVSKKMQLEATSFGMKASAFSSDSVRNAFSAAVGDEEDEDSEDLDFLAESDDETASPTPAASHTATAPDFARQTKPHKGLYQEMHSRVLQRLMGGELGEESGGKEDSTDGVTPLAGLVHSTDAFSFDAEEVLRNAQKEITQRMDRELAAQQHQQHGARDHGDLDSDDDDDDVDVRAMGRGARRRHAGAAPIAASTTASSAASPQHSGSQPAVHSSGDPAQDASEAGRAGSPIISAGDFKLQVPPELDAYDPESGISYVQHAENVLAARSARRATAVRTVFDKVLTSLGGARSLKPKHVRRIARELGLPQEQLAAMVDPRHAPGQRVVRDPPRGAPDRAGSVVGRILSMIESTEGMQPATPVDDETLARRTQRAERREESRRTRQQLQRAEHDVLMNTAFSPSPIQLSLSEQGGGGKEAGGGDSPPAMDTRLGSGGDAILDMLVPPEDTWHQAAQLPREPAPSATAAAAHATDASWGKQGEETAEGSELAQVLAMLEQEASSGGQGTSDAYHELASFPLPAPRSGAPEAPSALPADGESKVVVQPPPLQQSSAAASPGQRVGANHTSFPGAEDAAEDDDDAFSIGSTKWEDDDGVVDTRAYFEAGVGSGAAAAQPSTAIAASAVQASARSVGAGLSDSPELDGTGMTDDHREAVAASMALLANEPGMEFLRAGGMGGGGFGGMGYPGM